MWDLRGRRVLTCGLGRLCRRVARGCVSFPCPYESRICRWTVEYVVGLLSTKYKGGCVERGVSVVNR